MRGRSPLEGIRARPWNRDYVNGFRAHLIFDTECRRERLDALIASGATAICLPVITTRTALQSAVDEATRLGLPVYGWIELAHDDGHGIHALRRLVEAHPNLDGYFVRGLPSGARALLSGYSLIPVVPLDFRQDLVAEEIAVLTLHRQVGHPEQWIKSVIAVLCAESPVLELIAVVEGWDASESEILRLTGLAESGGATGVIVARIPVDQS